MKKLIFLCLGALVLPSLAAADDNIAACEVVIMKPVLQEQGKANGDKPAMIASFLPAGDFIYSVFAGKVDAEVDGQPIRGLMCKRMNVLPTEFDLKLVETGVPLYLSQDFDSPTSALMSIQTDNGRFIYEYKGPNMSKGDEESLKLWLKKANVGQ